MQCHECAADGEHKIAIAICRFCYVGLCKSHLVMLYRQSATVPQYACRHRPAQQWAPLAAGERSWID